MFLILIAVFLFGSCHVQGKCQTRDCDIPIQHYQELGCVPIYKKNNPCPKFFNCPSIENRCPDKCYYRGKVYNADEEITDANNYANCVGGCMCMKDETARPSCAIYDCARPPDLSEGCYYAGDHNTCCRYQVICPPFDNIANCTVNGTVYYEGQSFTSPTNKKLNCICKPGFKGKYIEPFCVPVNCGIEIYNSEEIRKNCAPVFLKDSPCPISWECEKNTDHYSFGNTRSYAKCLYGKKKLNIGDKVNMESSNVKCECVTPPLLTCYQS